jgi:hypothetical protein
MNHSVSSSKEVCLAPVKFFFASLGFVLFLFGAAFAVEVQVDPSMGTAESDCAPWDGPAYDVWIPGKKFGGESDSWIQIVIWQPVNTSEKKFAFPDLSGKLGHAAYFTDLKSYRQANFSSIYHYKLSGTVQFVRVNDRESILGELDLAGEKGLHLQGKFEAAWGMKSASCN